ncbi:arabinosyltransferase XEG113-like [Telopea speciosissima]|uniref:arabinosyltransferase XEG113-like n=1 Tax=Telopea speciosissima TaxID=54955 RepID=UPI001CC78D80|nr:arabinosyltransferase XEG113-like [Telopea speciosissima]
MEASSTESLPGDSIALMEDPTEDVSKELKGEPPRMDVMASIVVQEKVELNEPIKIAIVEPINGSITVAKPRGHIPIKVISFVEDHREIVTVDREMCWIITPFKLLIVVAGQVYQSLLSAVSARNILQGRNIYDDCCTLNIQFSCLSDVQFNYKRLTGFKNTSVPSAQKDSKIVIEASSTEPLPGDSIALTEDPTKDVSEEPKGELPRMDVMKSIVVQEKVELNNPIKIAIVELINGPTIGRSKETEIEEKRAMDKALRLDNSERPWPSWLIYSGIFPQTPLLEGGMRFCNNPVDFNTSSSWRPLDASIVKLLYIILFFSNLGFSLAVQVNQIFFFSWPFTVSGAYNIGIFHWRPTDSTKKLAKEWKEKLIADEKIWDQNGFNELMHRQLGPAVEGENGLVYAYDGILKLGLLPASIFCSGHTYFVQAMHQQLRLEPYAVHTTFQYAGTEGKRHRLREAMVFYDQPEYFDASGGFLSFKPSIPKSLLLDGEHNIESHFSLMNFQIKQIRNALAIASLLNRTLVMPPLWCRLDRLWFSHPGVLPGTMTRQPFLCPLDHVFEVNVMLKDLPEEEFGPRIDFREYSFLDNPLLPEQVKESWLDVHVCQEGSQGCHVTNETSQPGVLRFPKHSSEELLKTVFSSFKDIKVIQFSSMQDTFQGFSDKKREDKFRDRVKRYVGIWCCVENHTPGHIYYDMYWDEKPGWKPAPPKTPKDDHPPW